jgi:DNA-binding transcriptional LysR family regulator
MKEQEIPTNWLRSFVTVVDCHGYTRAAEALNCSQPTITVHIQRLEAMQGKLIDRDKKRLALTPLGTQVVAYARQILTLHAELSCLTAQRMTDLTVRIGLPTDFATQALQSTLMSLAQEKPNFRVEYRCGLSRVITELFARGELDIIVAIDQNSLPGHRIDALSINPIWVCGKDFTVPNGAPIPLIVHPEGCEYRTRMIENLSRHNLPWNVAFESPFVQGLQEAVENNLGVSALTYPTVSPKMRVLNNEKEFGLMRQIQIGLFARNTLSSMSASLALSQLHNILKSSAYRAGFTREPSRETASQ